MSAVRFLPGTAIITIWTETLDPYYADMAEGESFWTGESSMRLTMPFQQWPKPDLTKPKNVTRWRYEDALSPGGLRGKRVTKLPPTAAG